MVDQTAPFVKAPQVTASAASFYNSSMAAVLGHPSLSQQLLLARQQQAELRILRIAHLEAQLNQAALDLQAARDLQAASAIQSGLALLRAERPSPLAGASPQVMPAARSVSPTFGSQRGVPANSPSSPVAASGLDLLSMTATAQVEKAKRLPSSSELVRAVSFDTTTVTNTDDSSTSSSDDKVYIDSIKDWDVLCGRGGKSNHHPGNKRYRQVVGEMKMHYRRTEAKNIKTDLSRAIVEHVCGYGGRFVKKDAKTDRYYVLTRGEARKKTSQALRETKELKWTL